MDPSVPYLIPPCPPTRVPIPQAISQSHHDEMPPESIPFLLQLTSEHNVIPQQQQQHQQHHQQQQQQPQHHHQQHYLQQRQDPGRHLNVIRQETLVDNETQTLSWDEVLKLTIQKFLAHKVSNLIDNHNISGNNCIHIKGLSLEDILALVVENHNKMCLYQDGGPRKPQAQQTTAHVPIASYSETEAAASVMVEMLNLQHETILQQQASNMNYDTVDINFPNQPPREVPKKQPRKRSFAPVENTKEELIKRNIKIIRCDPPEEVMRQAQKIWNDKGPDGKRKHVPAKKWFQCAECGKKMEDISKLARHSALHTDLRPYRCTTCHKSYKTRDMLNKHRKTHLPREQVWKVSCPYCGKRFASRPERDKHVNIHTGERNKKCNACGETFKNATTLKQHRLRKHGLGKFVKCPFCMCTGVTRSRLGSHVAGVHKAQLQKVETGQLICPYKCLVCNEEFSDEPPLVEHMLGHGKGECSTCKSRKFRHVRLKAHARRLGLSPAQIDEKSVDELGEWVKEVRKKKDAERDKKRAEDIYEKAVARGMDPELAKDTKTAKEWLKQLDQVARNRIKNKTEAEVAEDAEKVREYLRRQREGKPGWNKPIKKEDLPQLDSGGKLVSELKAEIERLKKNMNQSAMEIALDIVEEINLEDVMGQSPMEQEMALVKAELQARSKKGNHQNSLAKRIIGEKIEDEDERVMYQTTTPEVDETQLVEGEETGDSQEQITSEVDNMMAAAKVGKFLRPRVIDPDVPSKAHLTCMVYSQSPRDTLRMIKQGRITYVFIPSKSPKVYATHMRTKPMQSTSLISQKIFVNTDDPDEVKLKLLAGQLGMKIVPLLLKKQNLQDKTSPSKASTSKAALTTRKDATKATHVATVTANSGASRKGGKRKYATRSKAANPEILLTPLASGADEPEDECISGTMYSPDPDATLQMIKSEAVQFFVAKTDSPNITATHNFDKHKRASSKLCEKITIHANEPEIVKASYLKMRLLPLPVGVKMNQSKPSKKPVQKKPNMESLKRKKRAPPKKAKIKLPVKKEKPVTRSKTGSSKPKSKRKTNSPRQSPTKPKRARTTTKKPVIDDEDEGSNPNDIVEIKLERQSPTKSADYSVFISGDGESPGTNTSVKGEYLSKSATGNNKTANSEQMDTSEVEEIQQEMPTDEEQENLKRKALTKVTVDIESLDEESIGEPRSAQSETVSSGSGVEEGIDEPSSAQSETVLGQSGDRNCESLNEERIDEPNSAQSETVFGQSGDRNCESPNEERIDEPNLAQSETVSSVGAADSDTTSPSEATENIEAASLEQIQRPSEATENIEIASLEQIERPSEANENIEAASLEQIERPSEATENIEAASLEQIHRPSEATENIEAASLGQIQRPSEATENIEAASLEQIERPSSTRGSIENPSLQVAEPSVALTITATPTDKESLDSDIRPVVGMEVEETTKSDSDRIPEQLKGVIIPSETGRGVIIPPETGSGLIIPSETVPDNLTETEKGLEPVPDVSSQGQASFD